jgi:hypothetical protein
VSKDGGPVLRPNFGTPNLWGTWQRTGPGTPIRQEESRCRNHSVWMPRWRLSPSRLADHTELIKSPFMPLRSKSCSGDLTSTTDQRPETVTNHTSFFVQIPSVNLIQSIYEEPPVNIQRIPSESSVNKLRKPRFAPIRSQTQDGLSTYRRLAPVCQRIIQVIQVIHE